MWVGTKGKGNRSGLKTGGSRSPSGAWNIPAQPMPPAQQPRVQEADESDEVMQDVEKEAKPHQPALQAAGLQAVGGVNSPEDLISQLKAMMEEIAAKAAEKAAEKAVQAAIAPITAEMRARKLARREDEESEVVVTDDERTEEDKIQQEKNRGKGNALLPPAPPASRRSNKSGSDPGRSRSR